MDPSSVHEQLRAGLSIFRHSNCSLVARAYMQAQLQSSNQTRPSLIAKIWKWLLGEPWLCIGVCIVALITLFYLEENWRGKRAWQQCKSELLAKGAVLDWAAFIPPAVPDDKNIFRAPSMEEWFAGKGPNRLTALLAPPITTANRCWRARRGGVSRNLPRIIQLAAAVCQQR